MQNTATDKKYI